jgi:hypothetical protein
MQHYSFLQSKFGLSLLSALLGVTVLMFFHVIYLFASIGANYYIISTGEKAFGILMIVILYNCGYLIVYWYIAYAILITQIRIWENEITEIVRYVAIKLNGAAKGMSESKFNPPQ